jgi:hypothetical protein
MIITLTEEEYNRIKLSEKEIYDRAYKDAYDVIMTNENAYLNDLMEIIAGTFGWQNTMRDSVFLAKLKNLKQKYKL